MLSIYEYKRFREEYIDPLHKQLNDLYTQEYPLPDDYLSDLDRKLRKIRASFIEIVSWANSNSSVLQVAVRQGISDCGAIVNSLIKEKRHELARYQLTLDKYVNGDYDKMTQREKILPGQYDNATCAMIVLNETRAIVNSLAHTLAVIANAIIYYLRLGNRQFNNIDRNSFNKIFPKDVMQLDIDDLISEQLLLKESNGR